MSNDISTDDGRNAMSLGVKSLCSLLGSATTSVGLSIAIVRLAVHALKKYYLPKLNGDNRHKLSHQYFTLFLKLVLGNLIIHSTSDSSSTGQNKRNGDAYFEAAYKKKEDQSLFPALSFSGGASDDSKERKVVHRGSCHCNSVHFALHERANLCARDSPGKIRYPHVSVSSSSFKITRGMKYLQMYYVAIERDNNNDKNDEGNWDNKVTAAHAFCKRCGVPILRAPDSTKQYLEINANCIENGTADKMNVYFDKGESIDGSGSLSDGQAVRDQWDDEDGTANGHKDEASYFSDNLEATMMGTMALGSKPPSAAKSQTALTESMSGSSWMGRSLDMDSVSSPLESSSSVGSLNAADPNNYWTTPNFSTNGRPAISSYSKRQLDSFLSRHLNGTADTSSPIEDKVVDGQTHYVLSMTSKSREPAVPMPAVPSSHSSSTAKI